MASPRPDVEMNDPPATETEGGEIIVPQVLFRAGKKRKVYRQRDHNSDTLAVADHDDRAASEQLLSPLEPHWTTRQATASPAAEGLLSRRNSDDGGRLNQEQRDNNDDDDEAGLSVAEALRLRNARRAAARVRGVEFRPDSAGTGAAGALSPTSNDDEGGMALAVPTGDDDPRSPGLTGDGAGGGLGLAKQFAHQTGMVSQVVNRHMEQYIESELARRHAAERLGQQQQLQQLLQQQQSSGGPATTHRPGESAAAAAIRTGEIHDKGAGLLPAMQGKLHEVDLGETARQRNVALTEKAWRRMEGDEDALTDDVDDPAKGNSRAQRVRLGRDGKPRPPPRGRKRRGSEDIERDKAVEEVLREARPPDVYAAPQPILQNPTGSSAAGGHLDDGSGEVDDAGAADDAIAEQFRREFLEAISQRQRRRTAPINRPKIKKERNEDILRGPKLGGSRNVRSQMRDILLAQEKEKKR